MWLNRGFFADNGHSGYVLKPSVLLKKGYNPYVYDTYAQAVRPINFSVRVRVAFACLNCLSSIVV